VILCVNLPHLCLIISNSKRPNRRDRREWLSSSKTRARFRMVYQGERRAKLGSFTLDVGIVWDFTKLASKTFSATSMHVILTYEGYPTKNGRSLPQTEHPWPRTNRCLPVDVFHSHDNTWPVESNSAEFGSDEAHKSYLHENADQSCKRIGVDKLKPQPKRAKAERPSPERWKARLKTLPGLISGLAIPSLLHPSRQHPSDRESNLCIGICLKTNQASQCLVDLRNGLTGPNLRKPKENTARTFSSTK
jgi:hypothetical protein